MGDKTLFVGFPTKIGDTFVILAEQTPTQVCGEAGVIVESRGVLVCNRISNGCV
jgi:hypothetical protein